MITKQTLLTALSRFLSDCVNLFVKKSEVPWEKGDGASSARLKESQSHPYGAYSVAEGYGTLVSSSAHYGHAEGSGSFVDGEAGHAEGGSTASGVKSHAEGSSTFANGDNSHAEGSGTIADGATSHAEGVSNTTMNEGEHAEGKYNITIQNKTIHTVGVGNKTNNVITRKNGHLIDVDGKHYIPGIGGYTGTENSLTGISDLATVVNGVPVEKGTGTSSVKQKGSGASASGNYSFAENKGTATANYSHAEGGSTANGAQSHAEGNGCTAESNNSHAEGYQNSVSGAAAHGEGRNNTTNNEAEHAEGKYNVSISGSTIHTVGIGTSSQRKNAHLITNDGKHYIPGIGGYNGTETSLTGKSDLATVINSIDTSKLTEITWSDLKTLRDGGNLVPGQQYRITDYNTTTTQVDTQSAGNQFDIIVVADSVNTLNENARAILHSGDTYFSTAGAKLEAWQLKYCLDNDTTRFAWAQDIRPVAITRYNGDGKYYYDGGTIEVSGVTYYYYWNSEYDEGFWLTSIIPSIDDPIYDYDGEDMQQVDNVLDVFPGSTESGKGVVYYMKDERDNECAYDFKNIMFKVGAKTIPGTVADVFYFTFSIVSNSVASDYSLTDQCYSNIICAYYDISSGGENICQYLNVNVFRNGGYDVPCYDNVFRTNCHNNTIGDYCYSNTFGERCTNNTLGSMIHNITLGSNCYLNIIEEDCHCNTFGDSCYNNKLGSGCFYNTFGIVCYNNTLGSGSSYNTFGCNCNYNTLGNRCESNTFGNRCSNNKFGSSSSTKSYYRYIIIEDGNQYIRLYCSSTTSYSNPYQNIKIAQGVNNTTIWKDITDSNVRQTYQTVYQPANSQIISV